MITDADYYVGDSRQGVPANRKAISMTGRRIVDARADSEGDITHVKLDGNQRFTPVAKAMPMADRGEVDNAHVVRRVNAKPHLRTNADGRRKNNLDEMAGDA